MSLQSRALPRFASSVLTVAVAALAATAGFTSTAHAAGVVNVSFVKPQDFSDAGRGSLDIERTTQALAEHLKGLGARIPDGQTLDIEVTDVNLAGELWPLRGQASEVRVLRGRADWPRIDLRYKLSAGSQVLKQGQTRVDDMNYMHRSLGIDTHTDLAYERRMLTRWLQDLLAPPQ